MENLKEIYEHKKVYVSLLSGRFYSGFVEAVDYLGTSTDNKSEIYLFTLLDKFGLYVSFSSKEIASIQIEKDDNSGKKYFYDG